MINDFYSLFFDCEAGVYYLYSLITQFPFSRFIVHGKSMFPTLKPGQNVLVFTWRYFFSHPKIGDIVVIKKNGKSIVKRIQKYDGRGVFVIGDNKKESTDSRSFGEISKSEIVGKVIFVA